MAVSFFPRGGSAQVMRYLARSLPESGWRPTLLTGSLGEAGDPSHAETFYSGIDVRAVDYTPSAEAPDPLAADPPFQPSYEDRPDAPDRVFAAVGDDAYERLVALLEPGLRQAGAGAPGVVPLYHRSPEPRDGRRAVAHVPAAGGAPGEPS